MNSFLSGNYAPVRDELTVTDLPVRGRVPDGLNGRLLRNGPNPIQVDDPVRYHWFVGDGMVHAIELRDGKAVSYRNRWVRTDNACAALGEPVIAGQPADPLPVNNVSNTNVICHAGKILTLVEVSLPTRLAPDLTTLGRYDFGGKLATAMTAHPKEDPVTGDLYFFGYNPVAPPYLTFHVADASGELVRSVPIDIPRPSMIHDMAVTERFAIFLDLPVIFDIPRLYGTNPFPAEWDASAGARIGLMPLDGDAVTWFDIEPCYVFHTLNAWEEGDRVVVDVCRYPSMFSGPVHGPDAMPALYRWTLDPSSGKVVEEVLDERGHEFPRLDDRRIGRRARYGYTTQLTSDDGFRLGGVVKHDMSTGACEIRDPGPGWSASEAVFVASGDGEDEGWLLVVAYDAATDSSCLEILSAQDITGEPAAVIALPQRVPFGFHGDWVSDAELAGV